MQRLAHSVAETVIARHACVWMYMRFVSAVVCGNYVVCRQSSYLSAWQLIPCSFFFFWVHTQNTERKIDKEDRFRHSRYLVGALLPFLKLLRQEQVMEKEVEANIQGMNFYFLYLFPLVSIWAWVGSGSD